MAARGKRAPQTEARLGGASDLLLVFGVAAFAIGLILAAQGVAGLPGGMLPPAWWGNGGADGEWRRDHPATKTTPVPLPAPQLSSRSPPRPAVDLRGRRDYRRDLVKIAALARRSWRWTTAVTTCGQHTCRVDSAMPGDWVPRPDVEQFLPGEEWISEGS